MAENKESKEKIPKFELLDFYADWCEPCKILDVILAELEQNIGNRLKIRKINIDHHPGEKSRYGISSVPVLVLEQNGKSIWRMNGFRSAAELEKIFKPLLENAYQDRS